VGVCDGCGTGVDGFADGFFVELAGATRLFLGEVSGGVGELLAGSDTILRMRSITEFVTLEYVNDSDLAVVAFVTDVGVAGRFFAGTLGCLFAESADFNFFLGMRYSQFQVIL
jgi:hypothetical protein